MRQGRISGDSAAARGAPLTPEQVRALAAPTRQEIVDGLESAGPGSVAALARLLGRKPDALYHHLRHLVRVGLIGARSDDAERGAVYALRVLPRLTYGSPVRPKEIARVVAGAQRLTWREYSRALAASAGVSQGPQRTLWGGRAKGWVDPNALTRVNQLLKELLAVIRAGRPGRGTTPLSLSFILAPAATSSAGEAKLKRKTAKAPEGKSTRKGKR